MAGKGSARRDNFKKFNNAPYWNKKNVDSHALSDGVYEIEGEKVFIKWLGTICGLFKERKHAEQEEKCCRDCDTGGCEGCNCHAPVDGDKTICAGHSCCRRDSNIHGE